MAQAQVEAQGDVEQYVPYHRWQAKEGIPSLQGLLIEDMNAAELGWVRSGHADRSRGCARSGLST